jgi:hypothetical protein
VVEAIRSEVGNDYHLQIKINAADYHDDYFLNFGKGNTLQEGIQVARWLEQAGVDALHISVGSQFPHPRNPIGPLPVESAAGTYTSMIDSGRLSFVNYLSFRYRFFRPVVKWLWARKQPTISEGINLEVCKASRMRSVYQYFARAGFRQPPLSGQP